MTLRGSAPRLTIVFVLVVVTGCGAQPSESGFEKAAPDVAVETSSGDSSAAADFDDAGEGALSSPAKPPPKGFHRDGWGPITAGLPTEALDGLGLSYYQTHEAKEYPDAPSSYFYCDVFRVDTLGGDSIYVSARDGKVLGVSSEWLTPSRSDLETVEGLRIGDSLTRIPELYPDAFETIGARTPLYVLEEDEDADRALTATTLFGVQEIRSGRADYAMQYDDCWRYPDPTP